MPPVTGPSTSPAGADAPPPLALEALSLNAWPALRTLHYDGWLLRFSAGYTRRANSVQVLYPGSLHPAQKIAYCEDRYTAEGLLPIFKLTSATGEPILDSLLAARGYRREAPTSVQLLPLDAGAGATSCGAAAAGGAYADTPLDPALEVWHSTDPAPEWIDAFCRLSGTASSHRQTMDRILWAVPPRRRCFAIRHDGAMVATALTVLERGCAGILDLVVDPALRGRGLGTALMGHLLRRAAGEGARYAYLQVMCANLPAVRLYARLGFREVYTYWYRVRRTDASDTCGTCGTESGHASTNLPAARCMRCRPAGRTLPGQSEHAGHAGQVG